MSWVLLQGSPDVSATDVTANRLLGIAAVITAIGAIVLGVHRDRKQIKIAELAGDKADSAQTAAANAETKANLAGEVSRAATKRADQMAASSGVVDQFRQEISVLTSQLIDMSASTSAQLTRATDALVACERREANLMAEMSGMRTQIARMDQDLQSLQRIVVAQAPGLVRLDEPLGGDGGPSHDSGS